MSVSIVTISYNQCNFLAEAIESVLSTKKSIDLELIVIDPGSTDGSRELILNYAQKDARIKYLFEEDLGPADGLNKGFDFASKDLIGFINSDDYYLPGAIEEVVELFKFNRDCAVLIGHGYKLINGKFKIVVSDEFRSKSYAYGRCNFIQQSTFYNRKVLNLLEVKFNLDNRTCWDGEFIFNISISGGIIKTFETFWGVFRIHGESISGSGRMNDLYLADRKRILEQFLSIYGFEISSIFNWVFRFFSMLKRRIKYYNFKYVKGISP